MSSFPAVDPIPLPAPVLLFKILHTLTLALHFVAVEMLLGGLAAAFVLNLASQAKGSHSGIQLNASASIARRLPMVMTYIINLGVPPLLFAQVLYGRALYTSSVLIGTWWIAVVFLLIGCYWHLYRFTAKIEQGKSAWLKALVALMLALLISRIYSTNMTLMLHPESWQKLYAESALGAHLPDVDPALMARWLFMVIGGLAAGGLWMMWLAGKKTIEPDVRSYLSVLGGRIALVTIPVQVFLAFQIISKQPDAIRAGLQANDFFNYASIVWLGGAGLLSVLAAWASVAKPTTTLPGWIALVVGIVAMLAMATCRDILRDVTLFNSGFDVWDRKVTANWGVISVFLVSFVVGLGFMAWLVSVFLRAKPTVEKAA